MKHQGFLVPAILLFFQVAIVHCTIGQNLLVIDQNYHEVSVGGKVTFSVVNRSENGKVVMKNAPQNATFNDALQFDWQATESYEGKRVMVDFMLQDSSGILAQQSVMILVKKTLGLPTIQISGNQGEKTIYHQQIGTELTIKATASMEGLKDPGELQLDYYFSSHESLKELEGAQVTIDQNELTFSWTPSLSQLAEKYFSLTIVAMDDDFHVAKKTLLLVVTKNNQSPYFIYPVLDEYYIRADESLTVDLKVGDADGDSLIYQLDIPTKIGNPRLDEKGKFTWRLNEDEMMRLRKYFPIEVRVEATEVGVENPITIVKRFVIQKSVRNQPPRILNLMNENIPEGLTYRKTVFIQAGNDEYTDLQIEIRGAPKDMKWEFQKNMLNIEWTPNFDVVGVEMKPEKFDMLLIVSDPYGYVDQKAFTITVDHRENTELTFKKYSEYRSDAVFMVEILTQIHQEMVLRESRVQSTKKSLSILTMFFAAFTASGTYFEDDSFAHSMVPIIGSLAVIAGGINAFGFNDLPKYGNIRENSFVLKQKIMYILAILNEYDIEEPNSPNLENAEFRENLKTFEQWAVKDKLDFKHYYSNFVSLSYIKRQMRKEVKEANRLGREPSGYHFHDMNAF